MSATRLLLVIGLLLTLAVGGAASAAGPKLVLVRAEESVAVDEFVAGLRHRLAGRAVVEEVRLGDAPAMPRVAGDVRLVMPVGVRALRTVLAAQSGELVLAALVPRSAFDRLVSEADGRRVSALFLDQPLARQMALIRVALPERTRVGVVLGPESRAALPAMRRIGERLDQTITDAEVDAERAIAGALEAVLGRSDVLLALPDPLIHNASTLQSLLLASYRQRVPVVGFSPAYTRAGALLSLHASPTQLAEQAADLAVGALTSGRLPAAQYSREFQVSVNRQVARSLAIDLPDDAVLVQRLRQRGGE